MPYDSNGVARIAETSGYRSLTELERAEVAALAALGAPEGVRAFALMRRHLRPGTDVGYQELMATIDRLSGPGFAEAAAAELRAETGHSQDAGRPDALPSSSQNPIGALALAQLLRDHRLTTS